MIFGVGTDIVEIERIRKALERWGERFAAKEAFTKALGTGIRSPAGWHGMWVVNLPSGKPELRFSSDLEGFLSLKGVVRTHLSLSDEKGVAFATVILECEK